ncbi:lipocalin family protein [Corynebacterium kalidii]
MRRTFSTLTIFTLATLLLSPVAEAQGSLDGGRLGGASSQIIPAGSSTSGGELQEIDGPFDLDRYAGTWYQVAAIPQPYSLQCTRDTTADYDVIDESTLSVRNSCGTFVGPPSTIDGIAKARSKASLRVDFAGVPFQDPEGPVNYRVTYLDDDYSLAVVGDPARKSGFVLSRTRSLTPERWSEVREIVGERGYGSCKFLTVPMQGGRSDVVPLCAL